MYCACRDIACMCIACMSDKAHATCAATTCQPSARKLAQRTCIFMQSDPSQLSEPLTHVICAVHQHSILHRPVQCCRDAFLADCAGELLDDLPAVQGRHATADGTLATAPLAANALTFLQRFKYDTTFRQLHPEKFDQSLSLVDAAARTAAIAAARPARQYDAVQRQALRVYWSALPIWRFGWPWLVTNHNAVRTGCSCRISGTHVVRSHVVSIACGGGAHACP